MAPKRGLSEGRVKRPGSEFQSRFEGESFGMRQPALVIFEGRAFAVLAHTRPQPPGKVGGSVQVIVNKNFAVHLLIARFRWLRLFGGTEPDSFGKLLFFKLTPDYILRGISKIGKALNQA